MTVSIIDLSSAYLSPANHRAEVHPVAGAGEVGYF